MANIDTFVEDVPDETVRNMARRLLALHHLVKGELENIIVDGEAYTWAAVAAELGPEITADLRIVYRAYRTAVATARPGEEPSDIPGA